MVVSKIFEGVLGGWCDDKKNNVQSSSPEGKWLNFLLYGCRMRYSRLQVLENRTQALEILPLSSLRPQNFPNKHPREQECHIWHPTKNELINNEIVIFTVLGSKQWAPSTKVNCRTLFRNCWTLLLLVTATKRLSDTSLCCHRWKHYNLL